MSLTCSLDYNQRLNSYRLIGKLLLRNNWICVNTTYEFPSMMMTRQNLHWPLAFNTFLKTIQCLSLSISHTHRQNTCPLGYPSVSFTLWDKQILGCPPPSSHLPVFLSLSLFISYRCYHRCGKLWQWWFSAFGVCESVNVHAGGCVTNVAVCWASHALIVRHRGCAYTQSLMRGRVGVRLWCSCRSFHSPEGLLACPILLGQKSLSFFLKDGSGKLANCK